MSYENCEFCLVVLAVFENIVVPSNILLYLPAKITKMLLLIVCLVINSLIGVIFKYFDVFKINNVQAITVNYFVCLLTGSVVLGRLALPGDLFSKPWFFLALGLGLLFVFTFNLMAMTVQHFGVGIATIFQKMSLIAPAILAMVFYGEAITFPKIAGISLAIIAIFLLNLKKKETQNTHHAAWILLLPISIFVGSCIIDTSLFLVERESLAPNGDIEFVASLFFFAGCFGLLHILYTALTKGVEWKSKNIMAGVILGIPNFFSIYLLLVLLANGWEGSVVFPVNNVGVLVLSALYGYLLFQERWNVTKKIGFALALVAIILIAL